MFRAYLLISSCHQLGKTIKESGEEIEEVLTSCSIINSNFDDYSVYRIQSFCKTLKQDTTLDPYNLFSINNSAFTSIVATFMTYIVVMIQFKTAELPLKA